MKLHAFVAMPFGTKQGTDFNEIYNDYIRRGLEQAGFEVFRADEELRSGDIRVDMFQELLLADLVTRALLHHAERRRPESEPQPSDADPGDAPTAPARQ